MKRKGTKTKAEAPASKKRVSSAGPKPSSKQAKPAAGLRKKASKAQEKPLVLPAPLPAVGKSKQLASQPVKALPTVQPKRAKAKASSRATATAGKTSALNKPTAKEPMARTGQSAAAPGIGKETLITPTASEKRPIRPRKASPGPRPSPSKRPVAPSEGKTEPREIPARKAQPKAARKRSSTRIGAAKAKSASATAPPSTPTVRRQQKVSEAPAAPVEPSPKPSRSLAKLPLGKPSAAQGLAQPSAPAAQPKPAASQSKRVAETSVAAEEPAAPMTTAQGPAVPFFIPPILLEGDEPAKPVFTKVSSRSRKSATSAEQASGGSLAHPQALILNLIARDPHCVYASWELGPDRQQRLNALSADGCLVLRVESPTSVEEPRREIRLHPTSTHWFVDVTTAGTKYQAFLGFYDDKHQWTEVARSELARTPPDRPTDPGPVSVSRVIHQVRQIAPAETAVKPSEEFARVSPVAKPIAMQNAIELEPAPVVTVPTVHRTVSLQPVETRTVLSRTASAPSLEPIEPPQMPTLPAPGRPVAAELIVPRRAQSIERSLTSVRRSPQVPAPWRSGSERTLYELASPGLSVTGVSSAELAAGPGQALVDSPADSPTSRMESQAPMSELEEALSSDVAPGLRPELERGRKFWLRVNAELIIYGATEPDAHVAISGKPIRLRPDGTFSYRFALPDGEYALCVAAVPAEGDDERVAELKFSRATRTSGEVAAAPADPLLRSPRPENL